MQRFRVRLPEREAIAVQLAEVGFTRASEVSDVARRTRIFAALAELRPKQRSDLARAVSEVCRLFAAARQPAHVRFGIGEVDRQRLIEVVVIGNPQAGESAAEGVVDSARMEKVRKLGQSLWRCELSGFPGRSAAAVLAQAAAPTWRMPSQDELRQWGELLQAPTSEDAVVLARRRGQEAAREDAFARAPRPAGPEAADAATDRDDLETLSLVAACATNAVLIMDSDGTIQWVNEAFTSLSGYSPAEVACRRIDELLFGPSTPREAVREFDQAMRNGHEMTQDLLQYHRDGRTVWVECRLIPIRDQQGRLARWIGIETDITRRRHTEEALRAAKRSAEESSRAKSEFLANMSHEIRTPLNAILGMTELALATDLSREQREYLRTVQTSADALLQLLNDVLDVSKIEAGKLEIEQIDFDLADIVRETLQALAVKAHEKGLELAVHMPMDIPQHFRGDPTRVRQILFNLVGNAIKFTERGEVVVDVEQQWGSEDEACLHFAITDTGIGIPKNKLDQIFESFAQVDSSMARRFGGSGLGLTITSQLLRLMNGKIWVQSQPGEGSRFHFTLRLKLGHEPPKRPAADASVLKDRRVLVVDDNATNRRILDELLGHWGMRTALADGAAAALEQLEDVSRGGEAFDIVLLDAMMPVVDGFELADILLQRSDLKRGTIMMLSSADRPNSAERCQHAGIATYLVKPVSAAALLEAILASLGGGVAEPPAAGAEGQPPEPALVPTVPPQRSLRVLVADDHEANRSLAIKILQRRGHRCTPASSGDQAIAACVQEAFDAVLMDVQMPHRDGLSATRWIRRREKRTGNHVPIIALTAHALSGDREKCLAAGMDAYLAKPLHARELIALVERITGASPDGDPEPPRPGPLRIAGFDFSAALDRMDGEADLLREHMNYTLHDAPQLLDRMRQAVEHADARLLEISAHRLKSLVSSYNHDEARELAYGLEKRGKDAEFRDAARELDRLATLVDEFSRAVRHYLQQQPATTP